MTKIPSDDILEGLYKLRIRESEKLKTVLELYDLEIHQKKAGFDYHRLKTMVKRSIKQNLRIKNFEVRNGNYERSRGQQREQRTPGDCWQWKANGQCSKGDNCSFRHDINKRAKTTQTNPSPSSSTRQNERNASRTRSPRGKSRSGRMFRLPYNCHLKGTCTNSLCENWHPPECLYYKSEKGCRFGEKCSHAHRQVEEQPSQRSQKNGDKSAVAMLKRNGHHHRTGLPVFGCLFIKYTTIGLRISGYGAAEVFIDFAEKLKHTDTNPMCKIHKSCCTSRTFETKILRPDWFAQVNLISVAPTLQNLRIGLRKRRNGKSKVPVKQRGSWPKSVQKFKKKNKATFFSSPENRCRPASTLKPEEREFVVDSGASMHMISKKRLEWCWNGYLDEVV